MVSTTRQKAVQMKIRGELSDACSGTGAVVDA